MTTTIRFKRFYRVVTVPDDAVYLVSEQGRPARLTGRVLERVAPLLGGGRPRDEIADQLAGEFSRDRVLRVLDEMLRAGYAVETDDDTDGGRAAFWELAQLDPGAAERAIGAGPVDVIGVGEVDTGWFGAAAAGFGLRAGPAPGRLTVVLTDDYERPELSDLNRDFLARRQSWLPVKPVGAVVWVGPVIRPRRSACHECLRVMMGGTTSLESYLRHREALAGPLVVSRAALPGTVELAVRLAALTAARWLADTGSERPPQETEVITFDTLALSLEHHRVRRRPQCPACGDPTLQARRQWQPVRFVPRPKADVQDGGHRASDPESFLDSYRDLVSPVSGPVSGLARARLAVDGLHVYRAGQNHARPIRTAADLQGGLRGMSSGKGMTELQARASALGEAVERYSAVHQGDEARIVASFAELGADAVEPNESMLYSAAQFADRESWNRSGSAFNKVAMPLPPDLRIEWTPLWSLTRQRHRYFPTAGLFFSYSGGPPEFRCYPDSNGCAAGSSPEDAAVQGFLELVERDAVAIWWYNRIPRRAIDPASLAGPYFSRWREKYALLRRDAWLLDLTTDLGIPTVAAVSYRTDKPVQDILFGFGAHFDLGVAATRAMCEMNQFLPGVQEVGADGAGAYRSADAAQLAWLQRARLEDHPYLLPAPGPAVTAADHPDRSRSDLFDDIALAQEIVTAEGLEMLVLDQTRVDIGLPVLKVIVPGLRHFWARFAPGRLYDVPVRMGWLDRPRPESELNPVPLFI